jgi:hypothetical protein
MTSTGTRSESLYLCSPSIGKLLKIGGHSRPFSTGHVIVASGLSCIDGLFICV